MNANDGQNTMEVTLRWQWNRTDSTQKSAGIVVSTSNRAVVSLPAETERTALASQTESKVIKSTKTYEVVEDSYKLKLTANANGSATVTVKSTDGKKKATLKVKVSTLAEGIKSSNTYINSKDGVEYIDVAAGGAANLGAAVTNSAATNRKLTYKVTTPDDKKAVSVNGSGVVAVSSKYAGGTAVVTISSKDGVSKTVSVNVTKATAKLVPVQDNASTKDVVGELNKKNVVALKGNKFSGANSYNLKLQNCSADELTYTVNKPAVCSVDEHGRITAKGNGTAVVTVNYKNDTKKSAKVTVKVTTDVEVLSTAAKEFTVVADGKATANINAHVNDNASNKKVTYSIVRVTAGDATYTDKKTVAKYASVTAKGQVKAKAPCTITVLAAAAADTGISQAVTVTATIPAFKVVLKENDAVVTKKAFTLKDDGTDQFTLTAEVTGKTAEPTDKSVKWTSNKAAVATVDAKGVVTVKGKGSAVITATAADGSKKSAKLTLTVKDERKASNPTPEEKKKQQQYAKELAAVKKAVDATITSTMKEENRDYLGFTTKFNTKTGSFDVDIKDPDVALADLSNTGLASVADAIARKHNVRTVSVTVDGVTHTATHKEGQIYVDEDTVFGFNDYAEAINYLKDTFLTDRPLTKDWNGTSIKLGVIIEQTGKDGVVQSYPLEYVADFTMNSKLYLQTIADTLKAEVNDLELTGVVNVAVEGRDITVEIGDLNQDILAADAADREAVLDALDAVLADATKITVSTKIPVSGGQTTITKQRTASNTEDSFVNDLLDEYLNKLYEQAATYGALDGSVVVVTADFKAGTAKYTDTYTIYAVTVEQAFDNLANEAIDEACAEEYEFGTVVYDAQKHAFAVDFAEAYADKAKEELAGTGLKTVIDSFLNSQKVSVVRVDGKKLENPTAIAICNALSESCEKLSDLNGKTSTVDVTYVAPSGKSSRTITYTITFTAPVKEVTPETVTDGDVTGGDVTDGDVTDGDVTGGDVTGGDITDGDVSGADAQ